MQRISLLVLPLAALLMAALSYSQDAETAADLAKRLGHDEYAVREAATKKLIELGEPAVPELERALKSDDLEVRLRAGRALRAIRGVKPDQPERAEQPEEDPLGPGGKVVSASISMGKGTVTVKITRIQEGKAVTKEYKGKSIEELKKKHPELKGVLGKFHIVVGERGLGLRTGLDMDRFWKNFGKDFGKDFDDDFWKNWQKDMEREAERLRKMSLRWGKQWEVQRGLPARGFWVQRGTRLGVTALRPSRVLDSQLGLRGRGIVIGTVRPNTLAQQLGLQRFDVLLELNGVAIRSTTDVGVAMRNGKPGALSTAKVMRRAAEINLSVAKIHSPKATKPPK